MAEANEVNDYNAAIIQEFRANDGRVGRGFENTPLLLLHSTGARSGKERINPVAYRDLDGRWAVFASKAGADTNPDWFHNLVANPSATIEVGSDTIAVTARVAERDERDEIWEAQKTVVPAFADYEAGTTRVIPVVVLEPTT